MAVPLADGVSIPLKVGSLKSFGLASHAIDSIHDSTTSVLEKNCNFDISRPPDQFRKTHIICTLGMKLYLLCLNKLF